MAHRYRRIGKLSVRFNSSHQVQSLIGASNSWYTLENFVSTTRQSWSSGCDRKLTSQIPTMALAFTTVCQESRQHYVTGALKTPLHGSWQKTQTKTRAISLMPFFTSRGITSHHRDFDFAGVAESGAWNFRSAQLEDGIERKRGTIFTRGRGVGEIAGRTCRG